MSPISIESLAILIESGIPPQTFDATMATKRPNCPVSDELESSYRRAVYVVMEDSSELTFSIDAVSPDLEGLLRRQGAASACFITAANPASVLQSAAQNTQAQEMLAETVGTLGYKWIAGVARDADGTWPDEVSMLVLDIRPEAALAVVRRFGQLAVVWIDQSGMPSLHWTK